MNFFSCNQPLPNAYCFTTVNQIPNVVWSALANTSSIYANVAYWKALEESNPHIQFGYMVVYDQSKKAIGLAFVQIVDFYLDSVQNQMESVVHWLKCVGRKLSVLSPEKPFKLLVCGNVFVTGNHGYLIAENENKPEVIAQLSKAILALINTQKDFTDKIDAFMWKDFNGDYKEVFSVLEADKYYPFKAEPNMLMCIDEEWQSYDDYLAAMKTKFRVKAKKALKQSANLQVREITQENITGILPEMENLYGNVAKGASFNLSDFNMESYIRLKTNLKSEYWIQGYWLEDKLVGFLSAAVHKETLDAHFVGIDYNLNRTHAIYQRMLYDYVRYAIENNLKEISFGRTASEIKSSIGAVPHDMTLYLRHKKSIPNKILSLFLNKIEPTEFKQKQPFKGKA